MALIPWFAAWEKNRANTTILSPLERNSAIGMKQAERLTYLSYPPPPSRPQTPERFNSLKSNSLLHYARLFKISMIGKAYYRSSKQREICHKDNYKWRHDWLLEGWLKGRSRTNSKEMYFSRQSYRWREEQGAFCCSCTFPLHLPPLSNCIP